MKHLLLLTAQTIIFIAIGYAVDNPFIFYTGIVILLIVILPTFSQTNLGSKK